jgi:hypothetical protein
MRRRTRGSFTLGLYVVIDKELLDFLRSVDEEFPFLNGVDAASLIEAFSGGTGITAGLEQIAAQWDREYFDERNAEARSKFKGGGAANRLPDGDLGMRPALGMARRIERSTRKNPPTFVNKVPHPYAVGKTLNVTAQWPLPWPIHHFVWQAPEGEGKSSIVPLLVERGFTVVFCSKTNDQLVEQEQRFKQFDGLRIHRVVSRARNLQERLAELGTVCTTCCAD